MQHIFALVYLAFAIITGFFALMGAGFALAAQGRLDIWAHIFQYSLVLLCLTMPTLFFMGAIACYSSGKRRDLLLVLPWLYVFGFFLLASIG
ncbi:hypothetical protein CXZ10_08040 [Pleomorphomonas diazotrophica]|uniref:Uncharacterized protein n=2 Tax=Pleomorphomonas diazotrophica TaxID=1166257 RepID=A0A1I4UTP1_9HYPH|nr:hypothetical protein CXZ10_08040 [Pleomorphomonas diazotrophica]SFM92334.1 hypothetical protein SAMN05192571_10940 [Pleomorphomonas diazotrophica]